MRSVVAAIGAAVGLAVAGCGEQEPSARHAVQTVVDVRVGRPLETALNGVGDIDGDGRPDVVVGDGRGRRAWLLVSRGGARLVPLDGYAGAGGAPSDAGASPLGDLDGDGLQDFAITTAHRTLAVLYGRGRWPRRVDLLAVRPSDAATITGTRAAGAPTNAARSGRELVLGSDCGQGDCAGSSPVAALPIPRRGTLTSVADATPRAKPRVGASVGNVARFWANGSPPSTTWSTSKGPLVQAGARSWFLSFYDTVLGTAPGAALAATSSNAPPGEDDKSALKLYRLRPDGGTSSRVLAPQQALTALGTLSTSGDCLVVSGWNTSPPEVWSLDPASLKTIARWSFGGSVRVLAQPMRGGRALDVLVIGATGRVARATLPVPAGKC